MKLARAQLRDTKLCSSCGIVAASYQGRPRPLLVEPTEPALASGNRARQVVSEGPPPRTETSLIANEPIAGMLREMADLLEQQEADGFRIAGFLRAAQTIEALEVPVEELARKGGLPALDELPA